MMLLSDKTYFIENLAVDTDSVPEDIQLFISDVIYRLFYSKISEIKSLQRTGQADPMVIKNTLIQIFSDELPMLKQIHNTIIDASLVVEDSYVSNNVLYNIITIEVKSTTGSIKKEVSTKVP